MARLLSQIAKLQQMVDKIITEEELIEEFKEKGRPLLAVDMTPREDFLHTNDLFRFHPLNLPRLSKFFQVVFLFKDLQGLVFTDPDTAKVISYKLYRLFKKLSPIDAKMILESEIIEEQIRDTPISFISSLYKTVLSTPRGKIKTTPYDALSMAVLFNETYHADIDAILLMNIEEENYLIVKKIFNKKNLPVPVALIRSFPDYAGIPHTHLDLRRKLKFPRVGDTYRDIIRSLKKFNTSISTIRRWYDEFIFHIKNTTSINRETFSSGIDIQRALAEGSLKLEDVYKSVAKDIIKVFSKYKHELDTAISEPVIKIGNEESIELLKAVSDPQRAKILTLLREEDLSALEIGQKTQLSLPTVLFHIDKLLRTKLVAAYTKKGERRKRYRLTFEEVILRLA